MSYIRKGDCLELMVGVEDESVDMILSDLPYGRTHNRWDTVIPLDDLWKQYNRIIKPNGCIALFGDGIFLADLMNSNRKMWKYNLVWDKVLPSGFLNAKHQPLRSHEEIAIFYKKPPTYNPQMTLGKPNHSRGAKKEVKNNNYNEFKFTETKITNEKYPVSIVRFAKPHPSVSLHPTQKPIELLEWLIKTYTNEGETVLDSCMGSGSTCLAAYNLNREYIGFEINGEYYDIAKKRLEENSVQLTMGV